MNLSLYKQIIQTKGITPCLRLGVIVFCFLLLHACVDNNNYDINDISSETSDYYWYSHTRSEAEQNVMLRNHGIGFSYDAVYGSKCDVNSVRCQVFNLDDLDEKGYYVIDNVGKTNLTTSCSHSFVEYCRNTSLTNSLSADLLIYKADYKKVASILERALETTICFTSQMSETERVCTIDVENMKRNLSDIQDCFSDNFLYALEKIKKSSINDIAVIDTFINVFGTHVVTQATVGGSLTMDVQTSNTLVTDYISEQTIKNQSLNLFFKTISSSVSDKDQRFLKYILGNSQISIQVNGGDVSVLKSLITNPSADNINATPENLSKWQNSVAINESNIWDNHCELIDMHATPIWELIPDENIATRIKSRAIATAPTMQELYGNRNFLSVAISSHPNEITCVLGDKQRTYVNPWVVDVIAAHRHVATICREWVPEITPDYSVQVVYPIYNNHIQLDAGYCIYNNKGYQVKWKYDRFEVTLVDSVLDSDKLYLNFGYLTPHKQENITYQEGNYFIGYEWPGGIKIDGSLGNDNTLYETRKLFGTFYINTSEKVENLPNWSYVEDVQVSEYYQNHSSFDIYQNLPYVLSGTIISNIGSPINNTRNRMVRDDDYVYSINSTEMGL